MSAEKVLIEKSEDHVCHMLYLLKFYSLKFFASLVAEHSKQKC
jgi:hypothetical protein